MSSRLPLIDRPVDAVIAHAPTGPVTVGAFEARVGALAAALPDGRFVVNLCDDRLHFLAGFAAALVAGQANLLPSNRQTSTVRELLRRHPGASIVHDGLLTGFGLPCDSIDVRPAANESSRPSARPCIAPDALAVVSFTSGSTGTPRANEKSWGMLVAGARINARAMLAGAPPGLSMLATVPPQHMYGLELSIMLATVADLAVHGGQPLYPADVRARLAAMDAPRCLVTTPAHLRALIASGLDFPPVARLFSATAPLAAASAVAAEERFGAELVEIYGCSEVGSVARRRTAREAHWSLFDTFTLAPDPGTAAFDPGTLASDPGTLVQDREAPAHEPGVLLSAPHVGPAFALQDDVELVSPRRFRLRGRSGDLLNIAGKRGSLGELNLKLLEVPGVIDGVIFRPAPLVPAAPVDATAGALAPDATGRDTRLAAIVVAPGIAGLADARAHVVNALRDSVDPVFLPRHLEFVDRLPRQASSKLPEATLQELWRTLRGGQRRRTV